MFGRIELDLDLDRDPLSLSLSIDCTGMIYHDISWYTIAIHSHVGIWGAQLIGTPALAPAAALRGHDEQYTREILTPAACLQWAWPDITWVILSTCLAFFWLISCNRERERERGRDRELWKICPDVICIDMRTRTERKVIDGLQFTSSTAQGSGGSFKNRKPIGDVGCCESRMAERIHWLTESWLELCFLEWLQWLQWSPHPQLLDVVWCTATVVVVVA